MEVGILHVVASKPALQAVDPAVLGIPRRYRRSTSLWSDSTDRWSLSSQVFALVVLMLLVVVVPVWGMSLRAAEESARNEAIARARSTAETLADSPWVIAAVNSPDPTAALSGAVAQIQADNNLDFIVVMDTDGTRWTHPDPTQIGRVYLGSIAEAVQGGVVVEEYLGTLGRSVRVVTPIVSEGRTIGLVAAGVLMDSVQRISQERSLQLLAITVASLVLGTLGTWAITRRIHRQTRGLGPLGLGRLYSYHEALLHSVRAGLVLVGRDGTVVLCNDVARELVGTPQVRPGQPVADLWLDPELSELMSSGRECDGETIVEDGRALVVTQVRAILDGEDLGWVTTLRDRTDLVRLTGELDSARSFGEMLRSRAHEADNRLHTVIMLVEMGRTAEAVELATATIEQSQVLVDAVTGAVRDAPLAALLLGKSAQAEERGVSLRLAPDLDVPDTGVAQRDILVVLGNLIDNAIDAAATGDEPRWVEVGGSVERTNGHVAVRFDVADSGPGIPPEFVGSAFQRGWSTKPHGEPGLRPQGRGLGLSLVAGTVRRLGGTIEVTRAPSRFVVRLPLPGAGDEEREP